MFRNNGARHTMLFNTGPGGHATAPSCVTFDNFSYLMVAYDVVYRVGGHATVSSHVTIYDSAFMMVCSLWRDHEADRKITLVQCKRDKGFGVLGLIIGTHAARKGLACVHRFWHAWSFTKNPCFF
jgi:hypothetical protein